MSSCKNCSKIFSIDKRFDVIASGSFLGINYGDVPSYPVGYVENLEMFSLDFEEFCWANGISKESIEDINEYFLEKKQVPIAMHEKMMELFKEYIVVGGMPRAVDEYVTNPDFREVREIQKNIISDYLDDIAKYAKDTEKAKARACFLSIPKQNL